MSQDPNRRLDGYLRRLMSELTPEQAKEFQRRRDKLARKRNRRKKSK